MLRSLINPGYDRDAVPAPSSEARAFHLALSGYAPTPTHRLRAVAAELGLAAVGLKDESSRLGLPAFKILGASWAAERTLRERPDVTTLVAASAGNHGRAVARVAALRGLRSRIFLPARAAQARRRAIAGEGAEVVVIDGDYEDAVRAASVAGAEPGIAEIADVGDSAPAAWVIDGYATLFVELDSDWDVILVPTGVGSLAAAAARHGAQTGAAIVSVEPTSAACLAASIAAGGPTTIQTPGTTMAGMDCAEVSAAAWPSLQAGIRGTVAVSDAEALDAIRELHALGLRIGDCGASALAALRAVMSDDECAPLREALGIGDSARVLLVATEGPTDPDAYVRTIAVD